MKLAVDGYEVREGKYPEDVGVYDALMMTGSGEYTTLVYPSPQNNLLLPASSAYDPLPWITNLIAFIRDLVNDPSKSHIKIIGICFGMQVGSPLPSQYAGQLT